MTKIINFVCNHKNCTYCGTYTGCRLDTVSFSPASDGSQNMKCDFFQQNCTFKGCRNLGLTDMKNGDFFCNKHKESSNTN